MTESIGDAKSNIGKANSTTSSCHGLLSRAVEVLERGQAELAAAVAGSPQADVSSAMGLMRGATEKINEAQQAVAAAVRAAEDVAVRL